MENDGSTGDHAKPIGEAAKAALRLGGSFELPDSMTGDRGPNAPQAPPQHRNRIPLAGTKARQGRKSELRLRKREDRSLRFEPPTDDHSMTAEGMKAPNRPRGEFFKNLEKASKPD